MAKDGMLPPHYEAQVQFQMFVTGLSEVFYISHRQGDYAVVRVKRDQGYIDDMIVKLLDFKRRLIDFDPPPLTERDYEDMSHDADLEKDIMLYNTDLRAMNFLKERIERKKADIVARIGDKNAKGAGWKVSRYSTKGRVDYDAAFEYYKVPADLEQFRKAETVSYRISVQ